MKNRVFLLFLWSSFFFAQENFTLSGVVKDLKNNETIIGATIEFTNENQEVTTNSYGFFSITLPKGSYSYQITKKGFKSLSNTIELNSSQKIELFLESESSDDTQLKEVLIKKNSGKINLRKAELSTHTLEIEQIKKMPVLMGEVDVLKSLTFLPGVTNGGETSSGINVRGGAVDQNLIQLDEATLFNSAHLFGFFSVFNADAIKDLKLYKGGIPARYGGRVSSVLDIFQRDGNNKEFHVNGGIGLLSSRLLAEGPIEKEKSSFLVAGRASYAHLFLKLTDNKNLAYFYDLNTKLTFKLNKENSLYFSGYFGRDIFSLNNSFVNVYGNSIANGRWNHVFSDKLFSNLSLIYSNYYYGLTIDAVGFNWVSSITNANLKYDFKYFISNKLKMNYGTQMTYHNFNPGLIEPINEQSSINYQQLDKKNALEGAFYVDMEHEITKKFSLEYGLRWSLFSNIGPYTENYYANNQPVIFNPELKIYESAKPISSEKIPSGKITNTFNNLEPRLAMAYQVTDYASIKLGYNRIAQYLHLLSNSNAPTPVDVWTPSGTYIKPQISDQISGGYFRNLLNNAYSLEVESFYKYVNNRIDYIDGANLIGNNYIESVILNGHSKAYGMEIMFRKNIGRLRGWISYTLSNSQQQTKGRTPQETGINNGEWYSTSYNRTHNIAITSSYKYNDKWNFSANFTLLSGMPTTYPNGQYNYMGLTVPIYNARNSDRLPVFHHLDVSATLTPRKNLNRKWKSEWVFGIYNIYNRRNPSFIFFERDDNGNNITKQLSIFGIVPSVTYNFKF